MRGNLPSVSSSYVPFSGAYYVDQGNRKVLGSQDLLGGYFDVTYNPWDAPNASNRGTSSFTLNLAKEFTGDLFRALDFTYGRVTTISIRFPGPRPTTALSLRRSPSRFPCPQRAGCCSLASSALLRTGASLVDPMLLV